jgi:hypothetical protein
MQTRSILRRPEWLLTNWLNQQPLIPLARTFQLIVSGPESLSTANVGELRHHRDPLMHP